MPSLGQAILALLLSLNGLLFSFAWGAPTQSIVSIPSLDPRDIAHGPPREDDHGTQPFLHRRGDPKELSDDEIIEIYRAKAEIKAHTTPSDLLLFIGNSASYFYFTFSEEDDRQVELVPITGRYYTDQWSIPSHAQQEAFNSKVLAPVIERHKGKFNQLVLIDHTRSGQTVDAFNKILTQFPGTSRERIKFINLVSQQQVQHNVIRLPQFVATIHQVQMPHNRLIMGLSNDAYYRLSVSFPFFKWGQIDLWKEQRELTSKPPQRRMIEKLRAGPSC